MAAIRSYDDDDDDDDDDDNDDDDDDDDDVSEDVSLSVFPRTSAIVLGVPSRCYWRDDRFARSRGRARDRFQVGINRGSGDRLIITALCSRSFPPHGFTEGTSTSHSRLF